MNIDSTLPAWMPAAGMALMIMMVAGVVLMIIRDIHRMEMEHCTADAETTYYTPIVREKTPKTNLKLKSHRGVDIEEITLEPQKHKKVRLPKSGVKT